MPTNAPKSIRNLRAAREKEAWDRQPGEKASEFLRFRTYRDMGRQRTLHAVAEAEREAKMGRSDQGAGADGATGTVLHTVAISGALSRVSSRWRWRERCDAYDCWQRQESHKELLTLLDHEARYLSHAQRLNALDTLMCGLMRDTLTGGPVLSGLVQSPEFKNYLALHRQMLATLREIRHEMRALEKGQPVGRFVDLGERLF